MALNSGSLPECAWDRVHTCRWNDSCDLILMRNGCATCSIARGPRDEDGEPVPPDLREDAPLD